MKLEQIAGFDWCLLKTCPGVFRNGDGDFVIQGRTLAQGELNLSDVPDHESLVLEVPPVAVPLPMLDPEPSVVPGVGAS